MKVVYTVTSCTHVFWSLYADSTEDQDHALRMTSPIEVKTSALHNNKPELNCLTNFTST